jgi:hypothetical protein
MDASLEARAQLAKSGQPGVRALHDPAVLPQPVVTLNTPSSNAIGNASAFQVCPATRKVVALVRM